jgi:hypothetical protein
MSENTTNPHQNTSTVKLIANRIRDPSHRKTQAEIASEAGFPQRENDDLPEEWAEHRQSQKYPARSVRTVRLKANMAPLAVSVLSPKHSERG